MSTDVGIAAAGVIGAAYSIPASIFRAYGGHLSDKFGARRVMYWTFLVSTVCTFILSYPPTRLVDAGQPRANRLLNPSRRRRFMVIASVLGFFMSLGKAAVFEHIPVYYPDRVGAVGGVVGLVGGLGGFALPIAFGALNDLTGIWQSCFSLLFALVATALGVDARGGPADGTPRRQADQASRCRRCQNSRKCSRSTARHRKGALDWLTGAHQGLAAGGCTNSGVPRAARFPAQPVDLGPLPAVVVRRLDRLVGRRCKAPLRLGSAFNNEQLFWLAALPGLSGATLRVIYAFMPAIFGGRLWTTLTTWSLLIPAVGMGFCGAGTRLLPTWIFLVLALLCGLGGGNFASSMANISFFFPKAEKGSALAINAGLGNLGVSVVQFVVPLAITAGVFGWLGGAPQTATQAGVTTTLWLQNAGFVFVPFIIASAFAAWFGMNDIATMKASFADQSVIFRRLHNWIMCWLYTGTFGSFIGFSAAFPLLSKVLFPGVHGNPPTPFSGRLIGALARALAGKACDRIGGARITVWVFVAMGIGTLGVLYAIGMKTDPTAFPVFFASFLFLFAASGVGNASTFQMIPAIMRQRGGPVRARPEPAQTLIKQSDGNRPRSLDLHRQLQRSGAFFYPEKLRSSIAATGGAEFALYGFLAFYVSCIGITWWFYTRRGGLLFDVEHRVTKVLPPAAAVVK